ncbi:MAG: hypothetical protein H7Y00_08550 [Fimbriimonadaceae bacterium]|nr:hypothetical protein [Chitinophagales bacterium]
MPTSQHSFEALATRFENGYTLINGWLDYSPNNATITKAALAAFVTTVNNANTDVTTKLNALGTERNTRTNLVFEKTEDGILLNPACFENRIRGIVSYLSGDFEEGHSATKNVTAILKKIRPTYPKKAPDAPPGAGKSPSEKSFASAMGHGRSVVAIVQTLGVSYVPPDTNLTVANMNVLLTSMTNANTEVQKKAEAYGISNRNRRKLFEGVDGLKKRRTAIKSYLASFPGLKKSAHYIEYNDAINGV